MTAPRDPTPIVFNEAEEPVPEKYPELLPMLEKLQAEREEVLRTLEPLRAQRQTLFKSIESVQAEIQSLGQQIRQIQTGRLAQIDSLIAALSRERKQTSEVRAR